jgi:magnesium transporter
LLVAHRDEGGEHGPNGVLPFWVDLLNPTPAEIAQVAAEFGLEVPPRELLQAIETSSRLRVQGKFIFASMSLAMEDEAAAFAPVPLGFILSPELLVTVRYSELRALVPVEAGVASAPKVSSAVFVALMEAMVDFDADKLEGLSEDLASLSARAFGGRRPSRPRNKRVAHALRECLQEVGMVGAHLSRIRESILGLQRILGFVLKSASWWSAEEKGRLGTALQDLPSLVDFQSHLTAKTQFILDAVLGFINTEQNEIFRVLTIVSVVGIPPTLLASMYGMNFHNMPELTWRWGYQYGLALIVLSIVAPIIWFKRRGWW